jgi:cysteine desulfurase
VKPIYLDYAATTPLDTGIAKQMLLYMTKDFGNPGSVHAFGRRAKAIVRQARERAAALLHAASPEEIFFTSGGSESDNWALKGIAWANRAKGRHIITTQIEHPAVLRTCAWLEKQGFAVTYLPVDREGFVTPESVGNAMRDDTILISVMMANNEVGTIEPIREIGAMARQRGISFHTDAVQAAGHIPIDVQDMSIDALSISGHKLYGPKGSGVLYLRHGTSICRLIHGGGQENRMRAGTENVPGIAGIGQAMAMAAAEIQSEGVRLSGLRDELMAGILSLPGTWINGPREKRLPGNVSFGAAGIKNDALLIRLDLAGFAVSAGSACSAGALEPSHVLLAMGQPAGEADAAIRVTIGKYTTEADIQSFLAACRNIIK